jgi:PAS domain S-box-containing protein
MEKKEILDRYGEFVTLLEDMNCGFIVRDCEGLISAINHRCLYWLGYYREEVEGRPLLDFIPEEVREVNELAMQATEEGDIRARLTTIERKDGTQIPVIVLPTRILDKNDEYAGTCSLLIELATVQTARNLSPPNDLQATLQRIAVELRSIAGAAEIGPPSLDLDRQELSEISRREGEVLVHLMAGDRVATIAKKLHISPHTVRNHLKSMYRKLDVPSQSELIEFVRNLPEI